jgi:hypothetical protein
MSRKRLDHVAGVFLTSAILCGIALLMGIGAPEEAEVLLILVGIADLVALIAVFWFHAAYVIGLLGITGCAGITCYLAWEVAWFLGQVPEGTRIRPMNLTFHMFTGAWLCLFLGIVTGVTCILKSPRRLLGWTLGAAAILISLAVFPVSEYVFQDVINQRGLILLD